MLLNENVQISNFDKNTFKTPPEKILLRSGQELIRFNTLGRSNVLGAYWMDAPTYSRIKMFAKQNGISVKVVVRSWLSLTTGFNKKAEYVGGIRLIKDCYAWKGPAKFQPTTEHRNVLYMGNSIQYYLPNLSNSHVNIMFFNAVD